MKLTLVFMFSAVLATAATLTRDFPTPAPADSQCSNLTAAPDGTLHLTYTAPAPSSSLPTATRALWLASLAPGATAFSAPRVIVSSPLLIENWA
ncbi:MAG: hypothetical protein FJ399_20415, partial [Verrucomicrobia bacterium]|nr:hypothetical protein [Verrucomicrobiota bacterium]